jgi:DNA polymerase epsilon subunit 1
MQVKPAIFVTYNGDFFDYPFVAKRAAVHDMDLYEQLGFRWACRRGHHVSAF